MQQRYGMGLVLAVVLSLSGCCCPMTCAPMMCPPVNCCPQVCWTERLEDMYCEFSDQMHGHACHLKHKMTCTMRQLGASFNSTCNCQSQPVVHGNTYAEMPVSAKIPPASRARPRSQQRKRCSRCRQSPCRCGYCEGCDGFEMSNTGDPANAGEYDAATYDMGGHQDQYEALPPASTPTPHQEPVPVPPVPPVNQGPTPIYRGTQPPAPTTSTSGRPTTNVAAVTPAPKAPVTPIDVSIPGDESLKLKPISFTTHAPLTNGDGWVPTTNSSQPAK